jgi:hypothetical protein
VAACRASHTGQFLRSVLQPARKPQPGKAKASTR